MARQLLNNGALASTTWGPNADKLNDMTTEIYTALVTNANTITSLSTALSALQTQVQNLGTLVPVQITGNVWNLAAAPLAYLNLTSNKALTVTVPTDKGGTSRLEVIQGGSFTLSIGGQSLPIGPSGSTYIVAIVQQNGQVKYVSDYETGSTTPVIPPDPGLGNQPAPNAIAAYNDVDNTFTLAAPLSGKSLSDYRVVINGASPVTPSSLVVAVGNVDAPNGNIEVYYAATSTLNRSPSIYNTQPFTVMVAPPGNYTFKTGNDFQKVSEQSDLYTDSAKPFAQTDVSRLFKIISGAAPKAIFKLGPNYANGNIGVVAEVYDALGTGATTFNPTNALYDNIGWEALYGISNGGGESGTNLIYVANGNVFLDRDSDFGANKVGDVIRIYEAVSGFSDEPLDYKIANSFPFGVGGSVFNVVQIIPEGHSTPPPIKIYGGVWDTISKA